MPGLYNFYEAQVKELYDMHVMCTNRQVIMDHVNNVGETEL